MCVVFQRLYSQGIPCEYKRWKMTHISVATCLRCGKNFYLRFVGNFILFLAVKHVENRLTFNNVINRKTKWPHFYPSTGTGSIYIYIYEILISYQSMSVYTVSG